MLVTCLILTHGAPLAIVGGGAAAARLAASFDAIPTIPSGGAGRVRALDPAATLLTEEEGEEGGLGEQEEDSSKQRPKGARPALLLAAEAAKDCAAKAGYAGRLSALLAEAKGLWAAPEGLGSPAAAAAAPPRACAVVAATHACLLQSVLW
eukprot:gene14025-biopygen10440